MWETAVGDENNKLLPLLKNILGFDDFNAEYSTEWIANDEVNELIIENNIVEQLE